MPALWRPHLRGLQGVLQEDSAEERQVRLPGGQELPGGQAEKKPLPVLPLPEVFDGGDGEGGGEDGQPKGETGEAPNETKEQPGGPTGTSSRPDHGSRQSACGVHTQAGESGLLTGIIPKRSRAKYIGEISKSDRIRDPARLQRASILPLFIATR